MADTGHIDRTLGVMSGDLAFRKIAHGLVWLTFAVSGFVMFEPAPYDALMIGSLVLFAVIGLPLPRQISPLLLLLFMVIAGGFMSAIPLSSFSDTSEHIGITAYLCLSTIFLASYVAQNPATNYERILLAYSIAAVLVAIGGIIGYFGLAGPFSESLTVYHRAKSFFKDPNVLGPFLVAPTMYAVHILLQGKSRRTLWALPLVLVCGLAIFLSFSRGAWGHIVLSGLIYGYLAFITADNIRHRFRLILVSLIGLSLFLIAGIGALSLKKVSVLFEERASFTQNYDTGEFGRFGRQVKGIGVVIDSPFGIGAKQFEKIFPEAPHNVYLNMFMLSGWLGGFAYLLLICGTIVLGFCQSLIKVPWQGVYMVIYASFVGITMEGFLIDTDHWRHFYVLLGLTWGGALAPGGILNRPIRAHSRAPK